MQKLAVLLTLALIYPVLTATTFIIKEGESEVGRYEESDGIQQEKVIQNEAPIKHLPPASVAEPVPPPTAISEDVSQNEDKVKEQLERKIYLSWAGIIAFSLFAAGTFYSIRRNSSPGA